MTWSPYDVSLGSGTGAQAILRLGRWAQHIAVTMDTDHNAVALLARGRGLEIVDQRIQVSGQRLRLPGGEP